MWPLTRSRWRSADPIVATKHRMARCDPVQRWSSIESIAIGYTSQEQALPARVRAGRVAISQRAGVHEAAELVRKPELVVGDELGPLTEAGERLGDVGDEWYRGHLAALRRPEPAVDVVVVAHADRLAGEVDVASLERASSSPIRSPVKAAVRNSAASCSELAARTSAQTSSGESASRSSDTR